MKASWKQILTIVVIAIMIVMLIVSCNEKGSSTPQESQKSIATQEQTEEMP